jgi:hypothetical protein
LRLSPLPLNRRDDLRRCAFRRGSTGPASSIDQRRFERCGQGVGEPPRCQMRSPSDPYSPDSELDPLIWIAP